MKKKKIIVGLIILLCVISLFFIGIFLNKKLTISDANYTEIQNKNIAEQEDLQENEDNSVTTEENNQDIQENDTTQIEQTEKLESVENLQRETTVKDSIANNSKTTETVKSGSTTQQIRTQEATPSKAETQTSSPVITQNNNTQPKENKNVETFKVNNTIIEKMKSIINSNQSETMKKFGYNIVVDSSIVNSTTGFTYTDARVKSSIANSFGTIRIYARDYYVNGELRWTEGFIL